MADKMCKIISNPDMYVKALRAYMCEYYIAHELSHPNIIQYKYLIRRYVPQTKSHEIHMLMEMLKGGDLFSFIALNKQKITIDQIKQFGG